MPPRRPPRRPRRLEVVENPDNSFGPLSPDSLYVGHLVSASDDDTYTTTFQVTAAAGGRGTQGQRLPVEPRRRLRPRGVRARSRPACVAHRSRRSSPSTTTRSVPTRHPRQSLPTPSSTFRCRHRPDRSSSACPPTVRTPPNESISATCAPARTRSRSPATTERSPIAPFTLRVRTQSLGSPAVHARRRFGAKPTAAVAADAHGRAWTRCSSFRPTVCVSCGVTPTRRPLMSRLHDLRRRSAGWCRRRHPARRRVLRRVGRRPVLARRGQQRRPPDRCRDRRGPRGQPDAAAPRPDRRRHGNAVLPRQPTARRPPTSRTTPRASPATTASSAAWPAATSRPTIRTRPLAASR